MAHQRDEHEHDEREDEETTGASEETGEESEDDDEDDDEDDEGDKKDEKSGKKSKEKLSFDAAMAREEAVAYFESIVAGLRSGTITFRRDDRALTLDVGPSLEVEVKASRKGDKQKVRFELSWRGGERSGLSVVES